MRSFGVLDTYRLPPRAMARRVVGAKDGFVNLIFAAASATPEGGERGDVSEPRAAASDDTRTWGWIGNLDVCGSPSLGAPDAGHGLPAWVWRAPTDRGGGDRLEPSSCDGLLRPRDTVPSHAVSLGRSDEARTHGGREIQPSCGVVLRAMRNGIPNFRLIFFMSSWRDLVLVTVFRSSLLNCSPPGNSPT